MHRTSAEASHQGDRHRPSTNLLETSDPATGRQCRQRNAPLKTGEPTTPGGTRKLGAEVRPVPAEMYAAIRNSGPCVYCGGPSAVVDHVRPLTKGGWEHEDNLVPVCKPCNSSKGAKLLREWKTDRVAHAIALSAKVAVEYARLTRF
ncbi:HNH endonuclease [Rhodococcus sp. ACPA1]|uniref:HNH endonuclease n=1 Tax=Rhodococcus sp. ACPA1 TaxID=2028572 RepID=UPI00117AEAEE